VYLFLSLPSLSLISPSLLLSLLFLLLIPLLFIDIACGDEHTGMITEDGRVWITGKGVTSMYFFARTEREGRKEKEGESDGERGVRK
jgi:hypothetical protein